MQYTVVLFPAVLLHFCSLIFLIVLFHPSVKIPVFSIFLSIRRIWDFGFNIHEIFFNYSAFEFITKLLRHLLPENFKSIRSYGFYNKSSKLCDKIKYIISREKIKIKRDLLKWKNLILTSFNRIPIVCPLCGEMMKPEFEVS